MKTLSCIFVLLIVISGCITPKEQVADEASPIRRDTALPNMTLEMGEEFVVGDYELVLKKGNIVEKAEIPGKIITPASGHRLISFPYKITRLTKGQTGVLPEEMSKESGYIGLSVECGSGSDRYSALDGILIFPEAAYPIGWIKEGSVLCHLPDSDEPWLIIQEITKSGVVIPAPGGGSLPIPAPGGIKDPTPKENLYDFAKFGL